MIILINIWFLSIIIFIVGNIVFVSKHKHLLIILLRLEFIVLGIFFFFILIFNFFDFDIYILIVFLVFSVCEGALGVSILISIIRTHGNDYFQSFSLL